MPLKFIKPTHKTEANLVKKILTSLVKMGNMGFFAYLERLRVESELKEQRDIFNSLIETETKRFRQKPQTLQETEAKFQEWEMQFRQWFIETYIIPKYFTNKKSSH